MKQPNLLVICSDEHKKDHLPANTQGPPPRMLLDKLTFMVYTVEKSNPHTKR